MTTENDYIRLTLTEYGAHILNLFNWDMEMQTGIAHKQTYKEGDVYECQIHEMLLIFGGKRTNIVGPIKFKDISIPSQIQSL